MMAVGFSDIQSLCFPSSPAGRWRWHPHRRGRHNHHCHQKWLDVSSRSINAEPATVRRAPMLYSSNHNQTGLPPPLMASTCTSKEEFLRLVNRSCKAGSYDEGFYLLESMVAAGHKPGVVLCTKLMKGLSSSSSSSSSGGIDKAVRVMEILEQHGSPDVIAYNALIAGFCRGNLTDSALSVLDHRMRSHGCSPDIVTYNILMGHLCGRGKLDLAMKLLDSLLSLQSQEEGVGSECCRPTAVTYTILIEASLMEGGGSVADAIKLLEDMSSRGLRPDSYTYNAILRGMCREGLVDEAWELLRSLLLLPSSSTASSSSSSSSSSSDVNANVNVNVISYNILLRALLGEKRWHDAERLVAEMGRSSRRQVQPNVVTYSVLISSLCQEGMVDKAMEALDDMMDRGIKPDTCSYDPIISAYCRQQGRIDLAIHFMDRMLSQGCVPDIVNFNTIMSSLCKSGNTGQALQVLAVCPPNTSSYNTVVGGLWSGGDRRRALEMVSEMLRKGIDPDEVTYNVLISCLCRDGMVDEAIHLMGDMKTAADLRPTVITYNTLLLGLCKCRRVHEAIDMFAEMVRTKCRPNETTYVILVEGVAHAGHGAEAAELGNALLSWNVISKEAVKRLKKTSPLLNLCK